MLDNLTYIRCEIKTCSKVLMRAKIVAGIVEIKCKCGHINIIMATMKQPMR